MLNKTKTLLLLGLMMSPVTSAAKITDTFRTGVDRPQSATTTTNRGGGTVRVNRVTYRLLITQKGHPLLKRKKSDFSARGKGYKKEDKKIRRLTFQGWRTFQVWKQAKNQKYNIQWILDYPGLDRRFKKNRTLRR